MVELALVFLIFGGLGLILLSMNKLLGPSRTNPAKEQPFECGSPYLQKGINPFPVKFYLVAFIFLLFINPQAPPFRLGVESGHCFAKRQGFFLVISKSFRDNRSP